MCSRCHRLAGHHVPSQTNRHLPIRKHVHRIGMNRKAETNNGNISLCGCVSIFVSNAIGFPRLFSHFRYIAADLARALAALLCASTRPISIRIANFSYWIGERFCSLRDYAVPDIEVIHMTRMHGSVEQTYTHNRQIFVFVYLLPLSVQY